MISAEMSKFKEDLKDAFEWTFHLSGFIIIGVNFFLPFNLMEKAVTFLIGALLIHMIWIK
jgi:hypothetical protein